MTISPSSEKCTTCNRSHSEPGYAPRHPFNDGTLPVSATFGTKTRRDQPKDGSVEVRAVQWPFDPVLRQALIDKGILTPQDLHDAEEKIKAVTAQWHQGGSNDGTTGTVDGP